MAERMARPSLVILRSKATKNLFSVPLFHGILRSAQNDSVKSSERQRKKPGTTAQKTRNDSVKSPVKPRKPFYIYSKFKHFHPRIRDETADRPGKTILFAKSKPNTAGLIWREEKTDGYGVFALGRKWNGVCFF
ncbi:MAG: hypothetical protein HP001_07200 [Oscillospiraceae bacterium]|nr:hypothetical protein [Oscillospiraceae bacterium]